MKHQQALILLLGALCLGTVVPCLAQTDDTDTGNLVNHASASSGLMPPPGSGALPGSVDPTHSTSFSLLKRKDVAAELKLTGKQQEALRPIVNGYDLGLIQAMRAPYRTVSREDMGRLSARETHELELKAMVSRDAYIADAHKRVQMILTPKQAVRLSELDLQWRTPLALLEPALTTAFALTPEQVTLVSNEFTASQTETGERVAAAYRQWRARTEPAERAAPRYPRASGLADAAVQKFLIGLKPELFAIRMSHGSRALESLTSAQKEHWITATGLQFTFQSE